MLIVMLLALLTSQPPGDEASPWPFQHIDKRAKLSNSAITSVYMDRFDHVWLGTWDGLDRYDGTSIRVYKPDPFQKGAISNNVVRNFLEDGKGDLWVVTHLGINKYNRTTDSFQTYLDSLKDVPFLEYNIRACIGPDSSVWASLIGTGINRYSIQKDVFVPVSFQGVDVSWLKAVVDLAHHEGLLYLLGRDGKMVCTVSGRMVFSKQLVPQNQLAYHKFLRIGPSRFLAIANGSGKLLLYNLADMEKAPDIIDLGESSISSLTENKDHTAVWVGTEAGDLFKISKEGTGFEAIPMNAYFPTFSKAKIKILTIVETSQDIVWVGTDGDGVYKFLTRPKSFYSLVAGPRENGQLSHNIIRSVYEDETGTLYLGTRGGGLNVVDRASGKTKIINTQNGLSNDAVLALNKDHGGNLWIGLDGEGVDMMEAGTGRIFHFPRDFENPGDLNFTSVYAICVDAFNGIWLGTSGYGIIHLQVSKSPRGKYRLNGFDQLSHSSNAPQISLKSNIVYTIVEEKPNILWFGTRGGGIYRYNSLTKEIDEHIEANVNGKNSLCNNDVLSLVIDKQNQLWIGTSGGLNRLHLQYKPYRIDHYTQHDGLPNNTIHGILEDRDGRMWISTNHGLVVYDRSGNSFRSFDTNDGLQNNEFTDGAYFQSKASEKLYFGGIEGLDIVHPSKLNKVNYFPRLIWSEFQVRNATIAPGDPSQLLRENIDFTDSITLNYDQNFIRFYFNILDYWNKQKSEYSYFLENFDKDWNHIGQQQSLTLTNIPPGSYNLYLNYRNENGILNSTPRRIHIQVMPPFWKSYWAYGFYILLGIGIQVGIVLYIRWRSKTKKATAMEKFKAQELKKLNDYKLQFFTNIAHEFRTPLTLILGPVTTLLNKAIDSEDKKQLKMIYGNSVRLQKLIEELMQFRKIESGKDDLEISELDLVPFTQEIVENFQQHASGREVHLEFYPEPETFIGYIDRSKVEKILINLISNAIKYNSKGGMVGVFLKESGGHAVFAVRDEGIGIAEANKEKIFESFYHNAGELLDQNGFAMSTGIGLSLTKSLVLIHRGKIQVESKRGKGSTFTVIIPVSRELYEDHQRINTMAPTFNLSEKISLEFESGHYLRDQPDRVANTVLTKFPHTLLVVDDNPDITSLLETILSDRYTILKASEGKRALEILEEERIDLVVSDVLMPDMDGLTLCRKIKENIQTSHIPVILLTAMAEMENRIEGLQVGADSYIPKPFHPDHLFVRIEKLIERMELVRKKFKNMADVELNALSTGIGGKDDDFFSKITRCIEEHLGEQEFNADTIAEEVGMSKASLYKKVKTITGLTPHGLIKQYRLKKASELLRSSTMSVSEVIFETGFNSRSYFYKSFNEMFHCHPKDFS
ncbi:MAG: two-component regulator propeller domain-containing protein [Cytophagales bacterium]|nr:two-component regulator propeller domain-containing protein [Cytophagales bacterium]